MKSIVCMHNICKSFGQVKALDNVDFDLREGEIHALVGENGAGKTTLMRILYGMETADSGIIKVDGRRHPIPNPQVAIKLGIGMVHQRPHIIPSLDVIENIALGMEPHRCGFFSRKMAQRRIESILKNFSFPASLSSPVGSLSIGLQQRVEILKVLYRDPRILIFDEPTSILTPQETEELFLALENLRDEGRTIVYISHKLWEVLRVSTRITVLKHGRVTGGVPTNKADIASLTRLMVGHELPATMQREQGDLGPISLSVEQLVVNNDLGLPAVKGVTLGVHSGEIIGVAGVEGNGQNEFAEALAGVRTVEKGCIKLHMMDVTHLSVRKRYELGLAYIPADRDHEGAIHEFSIAENLIANSISQNNISRFSVLQRREILRSSHVLIDQYGIDGTPYTKAGNLSGGNLQKVVIARALQGHPRVIVANNPTRGVDVGAVRSIHNELLKLQKAGCSVILISSDLDEIFALSNQIITFYEGRITGELPTAKASRESVGLLMLGKEVRAS